MYGGWEARNASLACIINDMMPPNTIRNAMSFNSVIRITLALRFASSVVLSAALEPCVFKREYSGPPFPRVPGLAAGTMALLLSPVETCWWMLITIGAGGVGAPGVG